MRADAMSPKPTDRMSQPPWVLLRRAAGTPSEFLQKLGRLTRTLAAYADGHTIDARLEHLHRLGQIERIPTYVQLVVGSIDMLRFWISPAAADYYQSQGIHYGFHQVLRILEEPASMVDPTGLVLSRDTIIDHLLQVTHANPHYDLQLLVAHDRGIEELELQLTSMLAGTHPKQRSIHAVVEDPEYHQRLLQYVQSWQRDPGTPAPLRENIAATPRFQLLEQTFGSLTGAMNYFCRLPTTLRGAITHLVTIRSFSDFSPRR